MQALQQLTFLAGALLCASIASVEDIRKRRIPNRVTGPAIAAGLALHAMAGGWRGLGDSALAGMAGGAIFFVFFLMGGMGAGDVKLMTAVACFAGTPPLPLILIATAFAGGVFALAVSTYYGRLSECLRGVGTLLVHHGRHGLRQHPDLNLENTCALRLPFALPIAAGCLWALCALALEARR